MSHRTSHRVSLSCVLTCFVLASSACLLIGCASVGSTPAYVSDAEKAKAQDPCQGQAQSSQDKATQDKCKKSQSK